MDANKKVAQELVKIIGGNPQIFTYYDEAEAKNVDIFCSKNVPQEGLQSCASIGLNNSDINLVNGERQLRVEILGACDIRIDCFENILCTVAFEIMDAHECYPGYIVENVIPLYIPDSDMKHVLLVTPFVWENAKTIVLDDRYITWLQIVPISENEYRYAMLNGVNELIDLFEEKDIDIYDIYRESVV